MFQHTNVAPDEKFCGICGQPLLGDPDDQPFPPLGPMDGECYRSQQMDCAIGRLDGITSAVLAEREEMVFGWCRDQGTPVAFVLAGGYISGGFGRADLVGLHRLTIEGAARTG